MVELHLDARRYHSLASGVAMAISHTIITSDDCDNAMQAGLCLHAKKGWVYMLGSVFVRVSQNMLPFFSFFFSFFLVLVMLYRRP